MSIDKHSYVLLSFDIEEFDTPNEYGSSLSLSEQISLSEQGTNIILDILQESNIKATFFCTTNFATHAQSTINRIISEGHEIASHGCSHRTPCNIDITKSKELLENLFCVNIYGYRQPRMQKVDLHKTNYVYNASINPTFIPGRYFNFNSPRTIFEEDGVISIPASVTPFFRIPLFWLSLHHMHISLYEFLVKRTLSHDGYFNTYFHPWEFINLSVPNLKNLPYIIKHNSGEKMIHRLKHFITFLSKCNVQFVTYYQMTTIYKKANEINSSNSML